MADQTAALRLVRQIHMGMLHGSVKYAQSMPAVGLCLNINNKYYSATLASAA